MSEEHGIEALRVALANVWGRGGRFSPDDDVVAAIRAVAPDHPAVLLDLRDDSSEGAKRMAEIGRRLELVCVWLRTSASDEEIHEFVGHIHEHYQAALSLAAAEQAARLAAHGVKGLERTLGVLRDRWSERDIAEELRGKRLVDVGLLTRAELVLDDRRLSRAVRIALSRLAKDSWMTTRRGQRVVEDTLRPLGTGDELEAALRNADVVDCGDRRDELIAAAWSLYPGDRGVVDVLRSMLSDGVVAADALPEDLGRMLAREQQVAWCVRAPAEFLSVVDAAVDAESYRDGLIVALTALPAVARAGALHDISRFEDLLRRHRSDEGAPFAGRAKIVDEVTNDLEGLRLMTDLTATYTSSGPDVRQALGATFCALDRTARPIFLRILTDTDRTAVCADALKSLQSVASPRWVSATLQNDKLRSRTARHLLKLLGEIGEARHAVALKRWLKNSNVGVRDAAIEAAFRLGKEKSLPVMLIAVYDKNPAIVVRAIHFLERLEYREPKYLRHLMKLVVPPEDSPDAAPADDTVRIAAIESMARLGNFKVPDAGSLEDTLLALLPEPRGFLGRFRRVEAATPEAVRLAALDALALVGEGPSIDRLSDSTGEPSDKLRARMARVVAEIRARISGRLPGR